MQATFFFAVVFPPPPAGPEVLACADSPGTGGTADAHKPFVMEGVVRDVVPVYVVFYRSGIPEEEWIVLDDLVTLVPFDNVMVLPLGRMLRPESRDPNRLSLQCPAERLHLADKATLLAVGDGLIKGIGPFTIEITFQQLPI